MHNLHAIKKSTFTVQWIQSLYDFIAITTIQF